MMENIQGLPAFIKWLTLTLSVQKSGVWYKWPNFEFLKLYSWYKVKNKASYNYTVPQPTAQTVVLPF